MGFRIADMNGVIPERQKLFVFATERSLPKPTEYSVSEREREKRFSKFKFFTI